MQTLASHYIHYLTLGGVTRVDSVRPFAAHIPGILASLDEVLKLNLSPKAKTDVHAFQSYVGSLIVFS